MTGGSDDEVKRGKPAPDIFLIAAGRFKEQPKPENVSLIKFYKFSFKIFLIIFQCLVFEDSPAGVTAALAAGMQVVAIPDRRISKDKVNGATVILNSLMDFIPDDFGLPTFNEE